MLNSIKNVRRIDKHKHDVTANYIHAHWVCVKYNTQLETYLDEHVGDHYGIDIEYIRHTVLYRSLASVYGSNSDWFGRKTDRPDVGWMDLLEVELRTPYSTST